MKPIAIWEEPLKTYSELLEESEVEHSVVTSHDGWGGKSVHTVSAKNEDHAAEKVMHANKTRKNFQVHSVRKSSDYHHHHDLIHPDHQQGHHYQLRINDMADEHVRWHSPGGKQEKLSVDAARTKHKDLVKQGWKHTKSIPSNGIVTRY